MELERESRANVERFAKLTREAPVGIFEADAAGSHDLRERALPGDHRPLRGGDARRPQRDPPRRPPVGPPAVARGRSGGAARGTQSSGLMRPDGEVRWVACHASPLAGDDGETRSFLGSMLDITERKLAEERTGLVVNRIAEAVSIIGPDGNHLHVNEAGQEILADLQARYCGRAARRAGLGRAGRRRQPARLGPPARRGHATDGPRGGRLRRRLPERREQACAGCASRRDGCRTRGRRTRSSRRSPT